MENEQIFMSLITPRKHLLQWPGFHQRPTPPGQLATHPRVRNRTIASWICKLIPTQCPFARQISLFGLSLRIPPLCKLNPFYDQLMALRFQAQCLLEES